MDYSINLIASELCTFIRKLDRSGNTDRSAIEQIFGRAILNLDSDPNLKRELLRKVKQKLATVRDGTVKDIARKHLVYLQAVNKNSKSAVEVVRDFHRRNPYHLAPQDARSEPAETDHVSSIPHANILYTIQMAQSEAQRERPTECLQMFNWALNEWKGKSIHTSEELRKKLENGAEPRDTVPVLLAFLNDQPESMLRPLFSRLKKGAILNEIWYKTFLQPQMSNIVHKQWSEEYLERAKSELHTLDIAEGIILSMSTPSHAIALEIERQPDINNLRVFTVRIGNSGDGAETYFFNALIARLFDRSEQIPTIKQYDCILECKMVDAKVWSLIGNIANFSNASDLLSALNKQLAVPATAAQYGTAQKLGSCAFISYWHLLERHLTAILNCSSEDAQDKFLVWARGKIANEASIHPESDAAEFLKELNKIDRDVI